MIGQESEIKELQLKMESVEQQNTALKSELQALSDRYAELESDRSESEKLEGLLEQWRHENDDQRKQIQSFHMKYRDLRQLLQQERLVSSLKPSFRFYFFISSTAFSFKRRFSS